MQAVAQQKPTVARVATRQAVRCSAQAAPRVEVRTGLQLAAHDARWFAATASRQRDGYGTAHPGAWQHAHCLYPRCIPPLQVARKMAAPAVLVAAFAALVLSAAPADAATVSAALAAGVYRQTPRRPASRPVGPSCPQTPRPPP